MSPLHEIQDADLLQAFQDSNPFDVGEVEILIGPTFSPDKVEVIFNFDNVNLGMLKKILKDRFPAIGEVVIEPLAGSACSCKCYAKGAVPEKKIVIPEDPKDENLEEEIEKMIDAEVAQNHKKALTLRYAEVCQDHAKVVVYSKAPRLDRSEVYSIFMKVDNWMLRHGYCFRSRDESYGLYTWEYKK